MTVTLKDSQNLSYGLFSLCRTWRGVKERRGIPSAVLFSPDRERVLRPGSWVSQCKHSCFVPQFPLW